MARRIKSEHFSNVDAAWLRMDRPGNRMMITGVLTFDKPLDFGLLQETIEKRFLCYPRFRQRIKEPFLNLGKLRWEEDPCFELGNHLHRVALPAPYDHSALQELVGELMSTPLDYSRPLWTMHYVENYNGGCAIIDRLHHCIADGLALVQVLLSMTDQKPDAPPPERSTKHARPRSFFGDLFQPLTRTVDKTFDLAETVIHEGMETIADPYRVVDAANLGVKGTRSLGKLLLTPPDHKTAFKGGCSGTKRAAWSTVLKLEAVKAVGKNYDATVNDVLLTAVSGAVRRYLIKRGEEVDGHNIRAMVPYNLRPPDEPFEKLGNKFGLVILSLPIGIENPFRRLRVLKKRMDDIKNMPEAYIAFGILGGMGWSPRQIEHLVVDIFTSKVSAVMTNVPGPRETLYLAGSPLQSLMFWVPTGGDLSLGVSILSYAGDIVLGIMTDAARCPDPGSIISAFQTEFEEMARRGRAGQAQARARVQPQLKPHAQPSPQAKAQCKALTKSGAQCKNRALPGTTTCARHAQQKAKEHA